MKKARTVMKYRCLILAILAAVSCHGKACVAQEALAAVQAVREFTAQDPDVLTGEDEMEDWNYGNGFLFLDGEYVPPPYEVQAVGENVLVNGRDISDLLSAFQPGENRKKPLTGPTSTWAARRLQRDLDSDAIIVLFANQPAKSSRLPAAKLDFCKLMLMPDQDEVLDNLCHQLPAGTDQTLWRGWLSDYLPPDDLANRLRAYQDAVEAVGTANQIHNDAVQRLNKLAYPLTTLGMVLSVLSIGHLLRNPSAGDSSAVIDASPKAASFVTRSLMLVVALSALDLVWTILASQAGQMRELNPLGSGLINSPLALLTFKAAMTCGAAGLLFRLRHYCRAQTGAWWACLICTLLTLRWLVLNSLFIA